MEVDYKFHFLPDLRLHMNGGMDVSTGKQNTDVSPYSASNNYYGSYGWEKIDKYNLSFNSYLQYVITSYSIHYTKLYDLGCEKETRWLQKRLIAMSTSNP